MHHQRSTPCSARTPAHVAVIMDGNGRWAQSRGLPRFEGHRRGVEAVRRVVRSAIERGVQFLTVYSFSSENWSRPPEEVAMLMGLLKRFIREDLAELNANGVRARKEVFEHPGERPVLVPAEGGDRRPAGLVDRPIVPAGEGQRRPSNRPTARPWPAPRRPGGRRHSHRRWPPAGPGRRPGSPAGPSTRGCGGPRPCRGSAFGSFVSQLAIGSGGAASPSSRRARKRPTRAVAGRSSGPVAAFRTAETPSRPRQPCKAKRGGPGPAIVPGDEGGFDRIDPGRADPLQGAGVAIAEERIGIEVGRGAVEDPVRDEVCGEVRFELFGRPREGCLLRGCPVDVAGLPVRPTMVVRHEGPEVWVARCYASELIEPTEGHRVGPTLRRVPRPREQQEAGHRCIIARAETGGLLERDPTDGGIVGIHPSTQPPAIVPTRPSIFRSSVSISQGVIRARACRWETEGLPLC